MSLTNTIIGRLNTADIHQQLQDWTGLPVTNSKLTKFLTQYVDAVIKELRIGIYQATTFQLNTNQIPIGYSRIRTDSGRIRSINHDQPKAYIADFFLINSVLITAVSNKGNNYTGKTMVTTNNIPLDFLLNIASDQEVFEHIYSTVDPTTNKTFADLVTDSRLVDRCAVDIAGLESFVTVNQRGNQTPQNKLKTLRAKELLAVARVNGGYIDQIIKESPFGRRYYTGPNLQNVAKEIRHAALGVCCQYDIKTAVYAWKLELAQDIVAASKQQVMLWATLEYLDQRDHHRNRLAGVIGNDLPGTTHKFRVNLVKQVFTAIGFGAKDNTNGWWVNGEYQRPALSTIVRNPRALRALLEDEFVRSFIDEQDMMNDMIYKLVMSESTPNFKEEHPELLDRANRINKNRLLAWLYQTTEREWVDAIKRNLQQYHPDIEILLTVHDGFYTRQRVNMSEMREVLRGLNRYAEIERTEHKAWSDHSINARHEEQHRAFIEAEERATAEWLGKPYQPKIISVITEQADQGGGSESHEWTYTGAGYTECRYDPEDDPFYDEDFTE